MSNEKVVYQGPGLCTLLGITFIVLKLCNVIAWSWWWVLAPFWIPVGLALTFLIIMTLLVGLLAIVSIWKS